MVGKLDIDKSAQKPILPLHTFFSYRTSPSTVKLSGLPNKVGDWKIEQVFVQYTYPDGVERSSTAKSIGNEFIATLDAPEASGTSKNGLKVVANCIDENGRHVDGFILAVGDIDILELDGEVHPGETVYTLKYLDEQPANPKKGDTYIDNGWLRIYDGQNWSEKPYIYVPTNVSQLENDAGYLIETDVKNLYSSDEQTRVKGDGSIETIENVLVYRFNYALTYDNNDPMKNERNFTVVRTGTGRLQYLHIYDELGNEVANVVAKDGNYTYSFTYTIDGVTYNGECAQTKTSQYENKWVATDNLFKASQIPTTKLSQFNNDLTIPIPSVDYVTPEMLKVTTDKIPEQASPTNQLADKDFVNSSIMTNTSYFKGTFNSVDELPTDRVTPNDYAFVVGQDSEGNTTYNRYKFTADGEWMFEYTLNNSSFTAEQWATINSGITTATLDEYAKLAYVDAKIQNQPTITLSGEYEDGTQFSFDAVIHN